MKSWTKVLSRIFSLIQLTIILLYFLPLTISFISKNGIEAISLYLVVTFLLLVPSIWTWISRNKKDIIFLIVNFIGLIWTMFWFLLLISTPSMD
jgi:heme/copper-type cytochrome/quinol oxidase subunit 4